MPEAMRRVLTYSVYWRLWRALFAGGAVGDASFVSILEAVDGRLCLLNVSEVL